jgi:hypothetical protein
MLTPPSKGFAVSVDAHNVRLDAMAEWIEGCITFNDKEISKVDVKDILQEEGYYRSQDFAQERIDDAWKELKRRNKCLGPAGTFKVEPTRLARKGKWQDSPAYSFCLMLSLQTSYRKSFLDEFGSDYTEQGELFERLTAEALHAIGWRTYSTAWSHAASNSIADKVEALALHLGEPPRAGAVDQWTEERAKDCGLDVICHLPFLDGWAGRPLYFVQCASGENWKDKRHTPNIQQWTKLLELATEPKRGIAHPFVLLEDEFRRAANYDLLSLVLDRHRLSKPAATTKVTWLSPALAKDLKGWTRSRLRVLSQHKAT